MSSRLAAVLDLLRSRVKGVVLSIVKHSSAAVGGVTQKRGEARAEQAAQLDAWEDEGGTPSGQPPASAGQLQHIGEEVARSKSGSERTFS